MHGSVTGAQRKWRPRLAFVLGGTLAAVLVLPLVGVGYFRIAGNILGWGETAMMIGAMALAATLVLTFLLWRLVLRPVTALTAYAQSVAMGRPGLRPMQFGTPEFSALGRSIAAMEATLNNRATGLRAYADHVTHELKSPLTVLRGATELLDAPDVPEADRQHLLRRIAQATDRMLVLLVAQRDLVRAQDAAAYGSCRLAEIVPAVQAEVPALRIEVIGNATVPIAAEPMRLVLTHLASNAARVGAARLTISADKDSVQVQDDGPGVAQGDRQRIFDPFFTTCRAEGGTGMGLPIVARVLLAHGAEIRLADSESGACFDIIFAARGA